MGILVYFLLWVMQDLTVLRKTGTISGKTPTGIDTDLAALGIHGQSSLGVISVVLNPIPDRQPQG